MNYFDYLRHNRRYHPHGFTDHTKCKYKQQAEGEQRRDFMFFGFADEARVWLTEHTRMEPYHMTNPELIISEFGMSQKTRDHFRDDGEPVSKEAYDYACMVFASTCKDIEDRVGKIPFKPGVFLPYDFYKKMRRLGSSTADQREGLDNYITLGNLRNFCGHAFGHPTEELHFDIARHEVGHGLSTVDAVLRYFAMKEKYEKETKRTFEEYLRENVSNRSVNDYDEAIADLCAIRFSPSYVTGTLIKPVEEFADSLLAEPELDITKKDVSMDESPKKNRNVENLPYGYRICVDPVPESPTGKIFWYDREKWDYAVFNTHEEMAKYAMSELGFPDDFQKRLFSEYPDRPWNQYDMLVLKFYYYDCGLSYDEIISKVPAIRICPK